MITTIKQKGGVLIMARQRIYNNLEAEIARAHLLKYEIAELLGMIPSTFTSRLKGDSDFKLSEMRFIRDLLQKENGEYYTLDYLFQKEKNN
jgi:hypothetical protein